MIELGSFWLLGESLEFLVSVIAWYLNDAGLDGVFFTLSFCLSKENIPWIGWPLKLNNYIRFEGVLMSLLNGWSIGNKEMFFLFFGDLWLLWIFNAEFVCLIAFNYKVN